MTTHDLSISVRHCSHLDMHNSEARLVLDSNAPPSAWTLPRDFPLDQLRACLWEWRETKEMSVSVIKESMISLLPVAVVEEFFLRAMWQGAFLLADKLSQMMTFFISIMQPDLAEHCAMSLCHWNRWIGSLENSTLYLGAGGW